MIPKTAMVGRADVLRIVASLGECPEAQLGRIAALVGAELTPTGRDPSMGAGSEVLPPPPNPDLLPPPPKSLPLDTYQPLPQWLLARRVRLISDSRLEEIENGPPLGEVDLHPKSPPSHVPRLFDRTMLGRRLTRLLTRFEDGASLDLRAAVRRISEGEMLDRLPLRRRLLWPRTVWVVLDLPERLVPVFEDQGDVVPRLRKLILKQAVIRTEVKLGIHARDLKLCPRTVRENGAAVLVLSDFGVLGPGSTERLWFDWVRLQRRRGLSVSALVPLPKHDWPPWIAREVHAVEWDRERRPAPAWAPSPPAPGNDGDAAVRSLLTLASVAIRVDPAFLRALRLSMPYAWDIGTELRAWNKLRGQHPVGGTWYLTEVATLQRDFFAWLSLLPDEPRLRIARGIFEALKIVREESCPLLFDEELLSAWNRLPPEWRGKVLAESEVEDARSRFERAIRSLSAEATLPGLPEPLTRWAERIADRTGDIADTDPVVKLLLHRAISLQGSLATQTRILSLGPTGLKLENSVHARVGHFPLARFQSSAKIFATTPRSMSWLVAPSDGSSSVAHELEISEGDRVTLETAVERLEFHQLGRPSWASVLGRDATDLFLEVGEKNERVCFRWVVPELPGEVGLPAEGGWVWDEKDAPAWIARAGVDDFGPFADYDIGDVPYRFRWIPPGRFVMGSPKTEWSRLDDEVEHDVELTQGIWLGEKPVTQQVYSAVTGGNPSHFSGHSHPVECVSWDDATAFARNLNAEDPRLAARLPTESEWEFACRGGQPKRHATYAGDLDDRRAHGVLDPISWYGKNSNESTHPVGQKAPNAFGLCDMLGNVWEWCEDWYGDYPTKPQVDPHGPSRGASRVLRGGSWGASARILRAAQRGRDGPSDRNLGIGFRLARSTGLTGMNKNREDGGTEDRRSEGGAGTERSGVSPSGTRKKRRRK